MMSRLPAGNAAHGASHRLIGAVLLAVCPSIAVADAPVAGDAGDGRFCRYPEQTPMREARTVARSLIAINEVEPNDTTVDAQRLPIGDGAGQDPDADLSASLSTAGDVDHYRLTLRKGDILGLAALGGGTPDTLLAVTDLNGLPLLVNDDHRGIAGIYPPDSPFPGGVESADSALTWIAPAGGDYLVRVTSWNSASAGPYLLMIRSRRAAMELENAPATQTIFLDFDGATINAARLFGLGRVEANLSPLSAFLSRWSLGPEDENDLIDAIVRTVVENFDDLRIPSLHGDRDTDGIDGHMDVEILNSRDHADPLGMPRVSRLIVGGTYLELGVFTIGVAQFIDPGNFGQEDTAVVLLDLLSAPAPESLSINSLSIDPSIRQVDAVGLIVGNIATHEAGHLLGNWHTENGNAVRSLMDAGGSLVNITGIGNDGILGTADDVDVDFVTDEYESGERVAMGQEPTAFRTAIGLATGAVLCVSDANCQDGDFCNGLEVCVDGYCQPSAPTDCNDGDECTIDGCEPSSGCVHTPVSCSVSFATGPGGDPSLGIDDVVGRRALVLVDVDRNPATLSCCCVNDPATPCCGNDVCDGHEDCLSCPDECVTGASFCGDGICAGPAAAEDCFTCPEDCRCAGGNCANACCGNGICAAHGENASNCPVDCDPEFLTPLAGTCCGDRICEGREDAVNCAIDCQACSTDTDCDDGNVCTDEACIGGRCQFTTNSAPCDDGVFCNGADTCETGKCAIHTGDPCVEGPECADTCDEQTDTCFLPSGTPCTHDGNVCTDNQCDGGGACAALPNTSPCDDGLFCTVTDTCVAGACVGSESPCRPEEFCHEPTDSCPLEADNLLLHLSPGSAVVAPGDTITVLLDAANLTESINGVQVLIGYDATLMTLLDILPTDLGLPDPYHGWTEIDELDDGGDVIWAAFVKGGTPGGVVLDHTVATLTFTAIDEGASRIIFRADQPPVLNKLTRASNGTAISPNTVDSARIMIRCDDGLFCNGIELLEEGVCQIGSDPCPGSHCDEETDRCLDCLSDEECDDGDACTMDRCDAVLGQCVNDRIDPCCGDGVCAATESACTCSFDCGAIPETEEDCANSFDDDCDGAVDCDDADCEGDPDCPIAPICGNGICEGNSEDCFTCVEDCRCIGTNCSNACCGDGVCTNENINTCPVDCGGIGFGAFTDTSATSLESSSPTRHRTILKATQRP